MTFTPTLALRTQLSASQNNSQVYFHFGFWGCKEYFWRKLPGFSFNLVEKIFTKIVRPSMFLQLVWYSYIYRKHWVSDCLAIFSYADFTFTSLDIAFGSKCSQMLLFAQIIGYKLSYLMSRLSLNTLLRCQSLRVSRSLMTSSPDRHDQLTKSIRYF